MDLPKNAFKAALRAGHTQIGLWCTIPDPTVAEMLGATGYDWMLLDTEHSPMDVLGTLPLLRALAPAPVSAVVRPASLDVVEIKKALDCGARSLLIPYIQSAEEARAAVAAVRYPPAGIRGVAGMTRASGYGTIAGYHRRAGEEICLLLQVETAEALGEIEAIAAVEGVDGIFVGPADLAASLGHPGETGHPEVKAAVLDAIRRISAAGLPPGVLTLDQAFAAEAVEAGARFVAVDLDLSLLQRGARARAAEWRARLG
ncbi:4-hydroxy-2-oxo-heptane-1,7-dioate aldolase (plasmid) [Paroceanicella profunda]|uniref:Hydroxypyruvate/pyruvate aldolase n=1 Tax=Paroceanicella profunda TaxID=2579971 RepID=A0A5B8G388_9RHOB|nr:aldolase/citrate lyase family protein [Paroceanicella profunda]QDL94574.1 4-hydroxy-2-oxo-heptane-1,7-dioate aldolase [Paroceanicella profunda]